MSLTRYIVLALYAMQFYACNPPVTTHGSNLAWHDSNQTFVYRDGVRVAVVAAGALKYFDAAPAGKHSYYVTSYNGVESKPSSTVSVTVP